MRLRRPLAHMLLHLVPLSTFALEKKQLDSGGEDLAGKCTWYEPCFDEDTRCQEMATGGSCFGLTTTADGTVAHGDVYGAIRTLALCRQSCRRVYGERKGSLTPLEEQTLQLAGGLGDVFLDPFGRVFQICNVTEGFTYEARVLLLEGYATSAMAFHGMEHSWPRYTNEGFKKTRAPKKLYGDIQDIYQMATKYNRFKREDCDIGKTFCQTASVDNYECRLHNATKMLMASITANYQLWRLIDRELTPLAARWSGVAKLKMNNVYGVRRYTRGAWLAGHVDHTKTHVLSAIINLGQKVEEPWPLDIVDYEKRVHKVILKPGDLVWYESSRLMHGRVQPLNGDYYDNIFVHWTPQNDTKGAVNKESLWDTTQRAIKMPDLNKDTAFRISIEDGHS